MQNQLLLPPLNYFHSKLRTQLDRGKVTKGLFFSLSGYTGTALEWYEENVIQEIKNVFDLNGSEWLLESFIKLNMIPSKDEIPGLVKIHTSLELERWYIDIFQSQIYIIQLLAFEGKIQSYLILSGKGHLVDPNIQRKIAKLDKNLKGIPMLNLEIISKVTMNLLDLKRKTSEEISEQITETNQDVESSISYLISEKLAESKEIDGIRFFSIKTDLPSLQKLVTRYVNSNMVFEFMSTPYIDNMINSKFKDYVCSRFLIDVDEEVSKVITRAAKIFPSVLEFMLFGDNSFYKNNFKNVERLEDANVKQKWHKERLYPFMNQIMFGIISDLRKDNTSYLNSKGVQGYRLITEFSIASELDLIFKIGAKGNSFILPKAKGTIETGSLLGYTDIDLFLRTGNILTSLQEFEAAISDFKRVTRESKNKSVLAAAWNGMGLCYKSLKGRTNQHKAQKCFKKGLKHDPENITILNNLKSVSESPRQL